MNLLNYGLVGLFLLLGTASILSGVFGGRFYFKNLGSKQEGPPMKKWLARPFFVALGCAFIYAAIDLLKHG